MTPALIKHHRTAWFFLLGFLPVLFLAAIAVLPETKPTPAPIDDQPAALPAVLKSGETKQFAARLRGAGNEERQLEIEVLRPLTNASALVYLTNEAPSKPQDGILLGILSSQNIYRFNIGENGGPQPIIVVFDPIKNLVIQTIKL